MYGFVLQERLADELQVVVMFICVMFMASLQFHWGIAKGALLDSPLISVGWAATILLLWNLIITTMQERYDYFTRSQHSKRYRPRRRLVVWELTHFVFSAALFGVSFYISFENDIVPNR